MISRILIIDIYLNLIKTKKKKKKSLFYLNIIFNQIEANLYLEQSRGKLSSSPHLRTLILHICSTDKHITTLETELISNMNITEIE